MAENQTTGEIQIIEKPDWVSWDDIHELLFKAHASNRKIGIVMRKPSLPGEKIRVEIEPDGKMFVAVDGDKLVGTAAIVPKMHSYWCGQKDERYAGMFFAAVLPEYNGKGIYRNLCSIREKEAVAMGLDKLLADTHEDNRHLLQYAKKNGFKSVDYKFCGDHYNVVMVKWLNGCPYSDFRCHIQFNFRRFKSRIRHLLKRILSK